MTDEEFKGRVLRELSETRRELGEARKDIHEVKIAIGVVSTSLHTHERQDDDRFGVIRSDIRELRVSDSSGAYRAVDAATLEESKMRDRVWTIVSIFLAAMLGAFGSWLVRAI